MTEIIVIIRTNGKSSLEKNTVENSRVKEIVLQKSYSRVETHVAFVYNFLSSHFCEK